MEVFKISYGGWKDVQRNLKLLILRLDFCIKVIGVSLIMIY